MLNCTALQIIFKIRRAKALDRSEIDRILILSSEKYSVTKIAKLVNRSRKVVRNLLKDPKNYGKKKSTGQPRAITERERRAIIREASNSTKTAREIAAAATVTTRKKNVLHILQQCKHLKHKKLKHRPPLTLRHKEKRLEFVKIDIYWKKQWKQVIFSDEKKINLDGSDSWHSYFHDLKKEVILNRRQMGGRRVMIWAEKGRHDRCKLHNRSYE